MLGLCTFAISMRSAILFILFILSRIVDATDALAYRRASTRMRDDIVYIITTSNVKRKGHSVYLLHTAIRVG